MKRDAMWLLLAAVFGFVALPPLVHYVGTQTLGPYAHGGLGAFLRDFFADLARLRLSAWTLALGPLLMTAVWRLLLRMPGRR